MKTFTFVLIVAFLLACPTVIQASEYQDSLSKNVHKHDKPTKEKPHCHSYYSILLIDLGNDGFQLSEKNQGAYFAYYYNPDFDRTQWVAKGTNDAFIMIDYNFNGVVDNAYELIGEGDIRYGPDFVPVGFAKNGYEDLAQYDDPRRGGNSDGVISYKDEIWTIFKLWIDSDANGVSSKHELITLEEAGLTEISISQFIDDEKMDKAGNILTDWSVFKGKNRQQYQVVDVRFRLINLYKVNNQAAGL